MFVTWLSCFLSDGNLQGIYKATIFSKILSKVTKMRTVKTFYGKVMALVTIISVQDKIPCFNGSVGCFNTTLELGHNQSLISVFFDK